MLTLLRILYFYRCGRIHIYCRGKSSGDNRRDRYGHGIHLLPFNAVPHDDRRHAAVQNELREHEYPAFCHRNDIRPGFRGSNSMVAVFFRILRNCGLIVHFPFFLLILLLRRASPCFLESSLSEFFLPPSFRNRNTNARITITPTRTSTI